MKRIIALCSFALVMFSCNVGQSLLGAYSLTQCKYDFNSISNISLGGVNVGSDNLVSSALALASIFTKSSIPLQFTLNLDVKNPGVQTALLNGLQYILEIDGIQMSTGALDSKIQVAPGETGKLPLNLSFDLKKAMSGQSADAIKNLALNFVGIGSEPTKVNFQLKPSFDIGGQLMQSPAFIPVSFSFGGKK
ncbi:MAG: hypothetical protein LBI82_08530 [Dysgonamonadaceae bacterium]|jgi:LEA14-like dessication related protein|nr:hypothetical protein [Dysgonamonadaceae bacterium]